MPSRLIIAFALSLALHGALLTPDLLKRLAAAPPRPTLQAVLRLPPALPPPEPEPLLKNTFEHEEVAKIEPPPKPAKPVKAQAAPKAVSKRELQAVQRKLANYIFYPEKAVQQGLEGTVRVLVVLDAGGNVEDVRLIASSGHAILDNAAIKGFYAIGKLPGTTGEWAYTFTLLP